MLVLRQQRNEVHLDGSALSYRILTYPFGTDSMPLMTADEYEQLPPEEKEHFTMCAECCEIFDRRSLDEVLFHQTDHKYRPDIQYRGSIKLD